MTVQRRRIGVFVVGLTFAGCAALAGSWGDRLRADGARTADEPRIGQVEPAGTEDRVELRYRIHATQPRLNRRLMGPVRRFVQGVPAEPVDSFVWDGVGSTPIEGWLEIDVEPLRNRGSITAEWTDVNGRWTYKQTRFIHPDDHPSGIRLGSSAYQLQYVLNHGIANNVYLHGDTGSGLPMLPTVFAYLAAWGPAEVTLNGELFENPFEIPAPLWLSHIMVTEGVRRPDGSVRTLTGEIFDPSQADMGDVEHGDLEAHIHFHDDVLPLTGNLPNLLSFSYHLVFEDVRIEIEQGDPIERAPAGIQLAP